MAKRCLLVFIKYPEAGIVKPALINDLGANEAANLYKAFIEDIIKTTKDLDMSIMICYDPKDKGAEILKWLGAGPLYYPQEGRDFGERLENAFYHAYSKGFEDVIVIGSDIPNISLEELNEAFDYLNQTEAVIGPTFDGGYYLLGFNRSGFFVDVFKNIPWTSNLVYMETWSKIRKAGKMVEVFDEKHDVNTFLDLEMLWKTNQDSWFKDSKTMNWIKNKGLFTDSESD